MDYDVQKKLMEKQTRLVQSLRSCNGIIGTDDDAVSAIVISRLTGQQKSREIQTSIFLVNGVLTGKVSALDGDGQDGAIFSLVRIYSSAMARETMEACKIYAVKVVSLDPDMVKDAKWTSKSFSDPHSKGAGQSYEVPVQPVYERDGRINFKVTLMAKSVTLQLISEIPYSTRCLLQQYVPVEELKRKVLNILPEPNQADCDKERVPEVVVCYVRVLSPNHQGRAHFKLKKDVFILLAKGNMQDISLPELSTYHAPLHSVVCQTWTQHSAELFSLIPDHNEEGCVVADFALFHKQEDEQAMLDKKEDKRAIFLEQKYQKGFRTTNRNLCVEFWSHNPNNNSLINQLSTNTAFHEWRCKLDPQSASFDKEVRENFLSYIGEQNIPRSFKYPTLQVSLTFLPAPNRMGMACSPSNVETSGKRKPSSDQPTEGKSKKARRSGTEHNDQSYNLSEEQGSTKPSSSMSEVTSQCPSTSSDKSMHYIVSSHRLYNDTDNEAHLKFSQPPVYIPSRDKSHNCSDQKDQAREVEGGEIFERFIDMLRDEKQWSVPCASTLSTADSIGSSLCSPT